MKRKKVKKGFTLIELLIVMAVIGVLGGIVILNFPSGQRRARDSRRRSDLKQYQVALEAYANANNGSYPNYNSIPITNLCQGGGVLVNYTSTCPNDPINNCLLGYCYIYASNGSKYVIVAQLEAEGGFFVVCSNGLSGVLGGVFSINEGNCPLSPSPD